MVIALFPPGLEPTGVSTSTESMWVCCVTPRTWRSVLSKEQCSRVQSVNRGLEGNMLSISIYFLSFVCKYLHTKCLKMRFRLIICLFSNVLAQEIEKSHNQNRKTKDGTTDSNKGKKKSIFTPRDWRWDGWYTVIRKSIDFALDSTNIPKPKDIQLTVLSLKQEALNPQNLRHFCSKSLPFFCWSTLWL